jgi:hypothetical protein
LTHPAAFLEEADGVLAHFLIAVRIKRLCVVSHADFCKTFLTCLRALLVSIIYDYFHAVILFYGLRRSRCPADAGFAAQKNRKARRVCTRQALLVHFFSLWLCMIFGMLISSIVSWRIGTVSALFLQSASRPCYMPVRWLCSSTSFPAFHRY